MLNRKKALCRILIVLALLASAAVGAVLYMKPDWRFLISYQLSASKKAELVPIDESELICTEVRADELSANEFTVDQSLMLVNKQHTLAEGFEPDICEYKSTGVMMNECITRQFSKLSQAVNEQSGQPLYITSSYRTAEQQSEIFEEEGGSLAMTAGASEHQTGLALDVYTSGFAGSAFLKSEAGQYVYSHCYEYGFIVRYPPFSDDVTGIDFEPWHIRYVGLPHSEIITLSGVTFEEYLDSLEYGRFYSYGDYTISRQKGDLLHIPTGGDALISQDNCGGYVITVHKK